VTKKMGPTGFVTVGSTGSKEEGAKIAKIDISGRYGNEGVLYPTPSIVSFLPYRTSGR